MAETVNSTKTKTTGNKPGQWKLVAVLAVVLVLLLAFGGGSDDTEESTELSPVSTTGQVTSNVSSTSSSRREIHWPIVPLEFLLTNNPFQPRATRASSDLSQAVMAENSGMNDLVRETNSGKSLTAREGIPAAKDEAIAFLASTKVKMIFRSARGAAAMIGERIYYEGEPIDDSPYAIASIQRDGVTLRKREVGEIPTAAKHDPQLTELPQYSASKEATPEF